MEDIASEFDGRDCLRLSSAPDGLDFDCHPGESVLESALRAGIPMAHACGGRARCSTCRIWIEDGAAQVLPPPTEAETALKARLGLGPEIRLACQFRPLAEVAFRRLVIDDADLAIANQLDRRRPTQAGDVRQVAVMFFDVAGFTAISYRVPPYDVMFLLNKLLTRAGRSLERYGGYFDKAIGDGFVAIFGLQEQEDCALRAVAAALDILKTVDLARPLMHDLYGVEFNARIGLHFGEALIGALGPAGDERLTVIGEVANIASRVEAANKVAGTRLLVTEEVHAQVADLVESPDFVRLAIPGVAERKTLHEVTGLTEAGAARIREATGRPVSVAPGRVWTQMCMASELREGEVRIVPQSRYDVVLTRQEGRVWAFNNHCPHNRLAMFGNEIPEGVALPPTKACSTFPAPGRIACRFHQSVFDLATGGIIEWCTHLNPDGTAPGVEILGDLSKNETPLEVFRCREAAGAIWVELQ